MINILLLFVHLFIWKRHKEDRSFLITLSVTFVVFCLMAIFILQIEVVSYNLQGTYGSDETSYYKWMILIKNGDANPSQFPAPLYNLIGGLILKISIIESVVIVRIFNVLMFSISLNLLFVILKRRFAEYLKNNTLRFKLLYILMALNGIVVWTAIRNLKDILFISLIIILIYLTEATLFFKNDKIKFSTLLILYIFMFFLFQNMRPFGGILVIIIALSIYLMRTLINGRGIMSFRFLKKRSFLLLLIIVGIVIGIRFIDFDMLSAFRKQIYTPMEIVGNTLLITILEFFRFILGPGPFNSLQQIIIGNVFVVSTKLADFLIFFGAIQWWLVLSFSFIKMLNDPRFMKKIIKISFDFFIITLFIVGTYTFVYGGTGDTRLRAIMYVTSYGLIIPFLAISRKNNKNAR